MTERKEYAIIRFFEQDDQCYKIDDVAEGENMLQIIKNEEKREKREMYIWFNSLAKQLELYHKSMRQQAYGHVNPYAVIVNEEGKVALLDIDAKENSELLKRMQKKNFRSGFIKEGRTDTQQRDPSDDIFGFGKLLLFMMEKGNFKTEFTYFEKIKLKRIVEKCANKEGNAVTMLRNIQKELNGLYKKCEKRYVFSIKILVGAAVIVSVILGVVLSQKNNVMKAEGEIGIEKEEEETVFEQEGELLALELAMLYFTEVNDRSSAMDILNNIKDSSEMAKLYLQIIDYIENGRSLTEEQWGQLWQNLEKEWERLGVQNKFWYKLPVLEACKMKDTVESWSIVREIGENVKENKVWNGIAEDSEKEIVICQYLGAAYEILEQEENALAEYERWKELETETSELEQIYLNLLYLNEQVKDVENNPEIMQKILEEAIQNVPDIRENSEFREWNEKYADQTEENMEETSTETITETTE